MPKVDYCCCGCSLRDGTLTLIVISLVLNVLGLLGNPNNGQFYIIFVSLLINAAGLYGVLKNKPAYLVPCMIVQILVLVFLLLLAVLILIFGGVVVSEVAKSTSHDVDASTITAGAIFAVEVMILILAALQYYFFVVIYSYYRKSLEYVHSLP